jgi:Leucine-rich repeat (LRR) protein
MKYTFCCCGCFSFQHEDDAEVINAKLLQKYIQNIARKEKISDASSSIITSMDYIERKNNSFGFKRFKSNDMGEITELYFNDCQIYSLPYEFYTDSNNIQSVWLKHNFLTQFEEKIKENSSIENLWISYNQFYMFPHLPLGIKYLYSDHNPIKSIKGIESYVHLIHLELNTCELEIIPEDIGDLVGLKILLLDENSIECLPNSFCNLKNLKKLSLHSNKLICLPEQFGNLQYLKWLSLHFNKLEFLPESFGNLTQLQRLSLHQNKLRTLPNSFKNLINIHNLSLFRNMLTEIPREIYINLSKCRKLAIQQNKLTTILEDIIHLYRLEEIWIYGNDIDNLPNSINNMINLKKIWADKVYPNIKNKIVVKFS